MLAMIAAAALPIAQPAGDPTRWVDPDSYPPEALAAEQEGKVRVTLSVGINGTPDGCTVDLSSGSAALDEGTCGILMSQSRFLPPKDEAGRPSRATWSRSVNWVIPRAVPDADLARYAVTFVQSTVPVSCTVVEEGQSRQLQPSICEAMVAAVQRNGGTLDRVMITFIPKGSVIRTP